MEKMQKNKEITSGLVKSLLINKDCIISNENLLKDKVANNCEELKLSPLSVESPQITIKILMEKLIARKISKKSIININQFDFLSQFDFSHELKFKVVDIKPKGVVYITENTNIEIVDKIIGESDLDELKIINVENLPKDYDKKLKLKSFKDLYMLMNASIFFHKYLSGNRVVYFNDTYFFESIKKKNT